MTREEGLEVVRERVGNRNLVKHMLATEAVMRGLAARAGEDEDAWGLAGLIHDIDVEETADTPERHGLVSAELLEGMGVRGDIIHAVLAHNQLVACESSMDRALLAADPVTGLIVAAVLMHPSRQLANVDVPFIMRRFETKRFAAGASREQIRSCEDMGIPLEEFLGVALTAMQGISDDLEL